VPSPVTAEDVEPLLVDGDDTLCQALLKFLQVAVIYYQYHKYKYDNNGNFTAAFEAEICSAPCFAPPEPEEEEEE
jgi:hypothetical protein